MSDSQTQSVLQKMTQRSQVAPEVVPLTVARAVKLAVTRAADESIGMTLSISDISEEFLDLDGVLAVLKDDQLLVALDHEEEPHGVMACDAGLAEAASEVQTFGRIMPDAPDTRPITAADTALIVPFISAVLAELEETTANTNLDGWIEAVVVGERFERARAVGFALGDKQYRLITLTLDFDGTDRKGLLMFALPVAYHQATAKKTDDPKKEWGPAFRASVLSAPLHLNAVLHRFDMPLSIAADLSVGQLVPLPGADLGVLHLEDLNEGTVLRGRMGRVAGNLAVRLEEPVAAHMQDLTEDLGGQTDMMAQTLEAAAAPELAMAMAAGMAQMEDLPDVALPESEMPESEMAEVGMAMAAAPLDFGDIEDDSETEPDLDLPMAGAAPMMMAEGLDLSDIASDD